MPFQALHGIRVLDISTGIAGPYCAKMLADYGAEVIKVEHPVTGDTSRQDGPFPDGKAHPEKSGLFLHLNANKRGVTLDIESPAGQDIFRRLVAESSILIENFKPGKMASLGIGYDTLSQLHPDLVMISITPFGQTGPHKNYEFTELTIFAMGGAMHREGLPDRYPLKYGAEIAQYFTGTATAAATMAASFSTAMTGEGDWLDISIQECMAGHPHQVGRRAPYAYSGELDGRQSPRLASAGAREPYAVGSFRCKDGFVSFLPLGPRMWPNLARMIGKPELMDNPRFLTADDRTERRLELEAIFQQWFDAHTRQEIFEAGQQEGLPCAPIMEINESMNIEQFKARGYFRDITHPDAGTLTYTGMPFLLSDVLREDNDQPAPRLGQHNAEVYGSLLGLGENEMATLHQQGVI